MNGIPSGEVSICGWAIKVSTLKEPIENLSGVGGKSKTKTKSVKSIIEKSAKRGLRIEFDYSGERPNLTINFCLKYYSGQFEKGYSFNSSVTC